MMHADLAFKSPVKIFGVNIGKDPLILYFVFVLNRISIEIGCSHDKQKYLWCTQCLMFATDLVRSPCLGPLIFAHNFLFLAIFFISGPIECLVEHQHQNISYFQIRGLLLIKFKGSAMFRGVFLIFISFSMHGEFLNALFHISLMTDNFMHR